MVLATKSRTSFEGLLPLFAFIKFIFLNIFLQEYYEEEDVRALYTETLTKLIFTLDDVEAEVMSDSKMTVQDTEKEQKLWPPWPWPPWGDDDNDGKKAPLNKTERAKRLAKKVVKFEQKIANASLDLYVVIIPMCSQLTFC